MNDYQITSHAIDQFIRRWRNDKTSAQAKEELEALLRTSKVDSKASFGGHIRISGHQPSIRMVIKERNVLVTVLPPSNPQEDLMALMQEETAYNQEQQLSLKEDWQRELIKAEEELEVLKAERAELMNQIGMMQEKHTELGKWKSELNNRIQELKSQLKE